MDDPGAAQVLFEIGAVLFILAGAFHAGLTLFDDLVRPRFFTPTRDEVREGMDGSPLRFRGMFRAGDASRPSIWRAWLGFNISHGLGLVAFGLMCLLLAIDDFEFVRETDYVIPLAVGISVAYLALSLRFWFYGPALVLGSATVCFALALVLA